MFKNHAIGWENQTVIRFEIKFCFFAQLKRNEWYCFKLAWKLPYDAATIH